MCGCCDVKLVNKPVDLYYDLAIMNANSKNKAANKHMKALSSADQPVACLPIERYKFTYFIFSTKMLFQYARNSFCVHFFWLQYTWY